MFQGTGKLIYDPHARIRFDPWWCILKTDDEIVKYYQYWLLKHYDMKFEKTVWGSHVSVNRGTKPPNAALWKKYKGEIVPFEYSHEVYRVHWFLCVDAASKRLEDIREELGLTRLPPHGYHITIGRLNKQYHSIIKCKNSSHSSSSARGSSGLLLPSSQS